MQKASLDKNKVIGDIFIPTSNRIDALKCCLDSLTAQTDKRFRILLVGKNYSEEVNNLVKEYTRLSIQYFLQKESGIIGAANEALNIASHSYFSRIDDDVILDKNWFKNLVNTFETSRQIGGVTGPTVMSKKGLASRDLTRIIENTRKSHNLLVKIFKTIYFSFLFENRILDVSQFLEGGVFTIGSNYPIAIKTKNIIEVTNLEACNWSTRTFILKKINGFDKIFLKGLGDYHEADSALKIKRLGYKLVFNSKVKLKHNVEIGKVEISRPHTYYRIQNFIIFYFRYFPIKSIRQLAKFTLNLLIQDSYYLYKFFSTGDVKQLQFFPGTLVGFYRVLFDKNAKNK
jgi:GT2 family glycosyltransferase